MGDASSDELLKAKCLSLSWMGSYDISLQEIPFVFNGGDGLFH